jgi:hypothetical protein
METSISTPSSEPKQRERRDSTCIDEQRSLQLYLETLSEKELKAYAIAKSHLGTSFQLEKSNGYLKWKNSK